MSVREELLSLVAEIRASNSVLDRILAYYNDFRSRAGSEQKSIENAIIFSDIVVTFYTCLETIFVRVCQYFENSLQPSQWHKDVLRKMTLAVEGIREPLISRETYRMLDELRRFRHFKRYY